MKSTGELEPLSPTLVTSTLPLSRDRALSYVGKSSFLSSFSWRYTLSGRTPGKSDEIFGVWRKFSPMSTDFKNVKNTKLAERGTLIRQALYTLEVLLLTNVSLTL